MFLHVPSLPSSYRSLELVLEVINLFGACALPEIIVSVIDKLHDVSAVISDVFEYFS